MSKDRCYDVNCGLVDTYRFGMSIMYEHHIRSTQIMAGSIKNAMKKAMVFALAQEEIERRFAHEQPQWSKIYDIPYHDQIDIRKGMTRLFKRDVHNTGKVAYINLTWFLREEEK